MLSSVWQQRWSRGGMWHMTVKRRRLMEQTIQGSSHGWKIINIEEAISSGGRAQTGDNRTTLTDLSPTNTYNTNLYCRAKEKGRISHQKLPCFLQQNTNLTGLWNIFIQIFHTILFAISWKISESSRKNMRNYPPKIYVFSGKRQLSNVYKVFFLSTVV